MIEVKRLQLEPERKGLKSWLLSKTVKRTLVSIIIGSLAGLALYYFTEGRYMDTVTVGEILKSMGIGGFFGFFITNSPCARNRC